MKIIFIIMALFFATLNIQADTTTVVLPEIIETPESVILVLNDDMEFHFSINTDGSLNIIKNCLHDNDHQIRVEPISGNRISIE